MCVPIFQISYVSTICGQVRLCSRSLIPSHMLVVVQNWPYGPICGLSRAGLVLLRAGDTQGYLQEEGHLLAWPRRDLELAHAGLRVVTEDPSGTTCRNNVQECDEGIDEDSLWDPVISMGVT